MAALGSVVVELSANIAKFESNMKQAATIAETQMKAIDQSLGLVKTSLAVLGAGFLANATFDKIKDKITGAIESAANLQKISEQTGVAADALSGLASVAKLSSTDTADLAVGLQKLSKSMVDAGNGGSKTTAAFEALGISAKDIQNQKPDEVFQKIAKQQALYADGAGKTASLIQLLGKSGANLIPVLKDLADAGIVQIKVTKEQAEAAEQYEQNLRRMEAASNALYKTIAFAMLPVMGDMVKALLETQASSNGVKKSVEDLAKDGSIRSWAESAALNVAMVIEVFQGLAKTARAVAGSFESVFADSQVGVTFFEMGGIAGLALESNRKTLSAALEKRNKTVEEANKRYADLWTYDGTALSKSLKARFADSKSLADDPELKMWNAMAGPQVKRQVAFNPNKEANAGKDDPAKLYLEGQVKKYDAFIAAEKTQLQTREQYLDAYRGMEYFTLRETEEKKQQLIAQSLAKTQADYDIEIAAANAYLAHEKAIGSAKGTQDGVNKVAEIAKKRSDATIEANKKMTDSQLVLEQAKAQFNIGTEEADRQQKKANADSEFQISLLGQNTLEVQKLTSARQIQLTLDERIFQLKKIDPTVDTSKAIADAAIQQANAGALITESYNKQRTGIFGASEAMRKYGEDAGNTAAQIETTMTDALKGMEDAFVTFATTGKLSFAGLANSIIANLARIEAKNLIASLTKSDSAGGGIGGLLSSLFGSPNGTGLAASQGGTLGGGSVADFMQMDAVAAFAGGGDPPLGRASLVGEKGPELFVPKSAGTIIPNSALQGGGGTSQVINIRIDGTTDMARNQQLVRAAVQQGNAQLVDRLARAGRL
jgi:hypothetical protein